tara:strand:- start:147 stop:1211 length:1065 start_codon:yes stop_codon:yes gene_type:complete
MISESIKSGRLNKGLNIRELARLIDVDSTLISRFESGDRLPTESQLEGMIFQLELDSKIIKAEWLAEKIVKVIQYQPEARQALIIAESRIEYLKTTTTYAVDEVSDRIRERLQLADDLKKEWQSKKPLTGVQLYKMKEYFHIENTYESNRIEGNTLTLQETQLVVNEGLTISGKSMREHLEAINHVDALEYVEEMVLEQVPINKSSILDLHRLILKGVDTHNAGVYRTVPVRISGSRHEPPQVYLIEKLMEDFFGFYHAQKNKMHPILLAAEMHERLVSIHPFIDGNGRTSRLIMNLVLIQNGYTLTNIKGDNDSRLQYYRALESVQIDNNPEPFYSLVIDSAINSLEEHLKLV